MGTDHDDRSERSADPRGAEPQAGAEGRSGRDAIAELFTASAQLAEADTPEAVARLALAGCVPVLGARRAVVAVVVAGGPPPSMLTVLHRFAPADPAPADAADAADDLLRSAAGVALDGGPMAAEAMRTGRISRSREGAIHVPMIAAGEARGVLVIEPADGVALDASLGRALSSYAQHVAVALDRTWREHDRRRALARAATEAARAAALHRVTSALSRCPAVEGVLAAALDAIHDVLAPELVAVVVRRDGRLHRAVSRRDAPMAGDSRQWFPLDEPNPLSATAEDGRSRWFERPADLAEEFGDSSGADPGRGAGRGLPLGLALGEAGGIVALVIDGAPVGALLVSFARARSLSAADRALVESLSTLCSEALRRFRLVEDERRSAVRRRAVHRVSTALSESEGDEDTCDAVASAVYEAFGPDGLASVGLLDAGGRLKVTFIDAARPQVTDHETIEVSARRPLAAVARDGRARRYDRDAEVSSEFGTDNDALAGYEASSAVPVLVDGEVAGVLGVAYHRPNQVSADDDDLLRTLATMCGDGLRRVRMQRQERLALARTEALHRVTEAFSRAVTVGEVITAAMAALWEVLDPTSCGAIVIDDDGRIRWWRRVRHDTEPLSSGETAAGALREPVRSVLRDGRARFFNTAEEARAGFAEEELDARSCTAGGHVPLVIDGVTAGALGVECDGRPISPADRELLTSLVALCAEAVRRARLFEEERRAASRQATLRLATEALSRASRVPEVLEALSASLGALLAPAMVAAADDDGRLRLASSGPPDRVDAALPEVVPGDAVAGGAVPAEVLAALRASLDGAPLRWISTEQPSSTVRRGGVEPLGRPMHLGADVPLRAEGRVIGALAVRFERPRLIGVRDQEVVEAIAALAAGALRRARLFEDERRAAVRSTVLHRLAGALARAATMEEVLEVAIGELYDALDPDASAAGIVRGDRLQLVCTRGTVPGSRPYSDDLPIDGSRPATAVVLDGRACWFDADDPLPYAGARAPWRSGALIPLGVDGRALGVLTIAWLHADRVRPADRELLETVEGMCSEALRRARDLQQLQQAALRHQQLFDGYERLFRNHPQPLMVLATPDDHILAVNAALLEQFGYREGDLVGRHGGVLMHERERARYLAERAAADPALRVLPRRRLLLMQRSDGSTFVALSTSHDAVEFAGRPARVVLLIDETAKVRAEQERRRIQERMVAVAEDERRRIAVDLHDGPVQQLSVAAMRLAALRRQIDGGGALSPVGVQRIERDVQATVDELRTMMVELYPPALDELSLGEALADAIAHAARAGSVGVHLHDRLRRAMPVGVKAALYRVVVEALANVHKHAQASAVRVELQERGDRVEIRVIDDGVGLDERQHQRPGHLGLASMQDRISLLGGTCQIGPGPDGVGTMVQASVPLPAADVADHA